ncbi:DUF1684 domain-containing protein [Actinoplanes sp. KI2]|uniref:DUF1684 domain-containing protein n=1 Tax=Actinoplanes sp. KI2 TaxID=2983315 RepID=UPI0021D57732|nr:DUF1684 domain-containing protein [Actinoplanes sp. KI2]MCU7727611.1 DUF1684 domain-containing protein [Actinoplanes sp. KI2]
MYSDVWAEWHAEHERRRSAPHGFLAVTGLHWLSGSPQRFEDVPGEWSSSPGGVTVTLRDGEDLTLGDRPLGVGAHDLGKVDEDGITAAFGDAIVEIARRGEGIIVRPRHPENQLRLAYEGTPTFPPSEQWLIPARFVPLAAARSVSLTTVVDGLLEPDLAVGRVEFSIDDAALSLTVFPGAAPGSLTTLFTDATSGVTTYPASRRLHLPAPAADGTLTIDFNRATNLPCAYTPFATCALAPPENRLPVAITAGEKTPPTSAH